MLFSIRCFTPVFFLSLWFAFFHLRTSLVSCRRSRTVIWAYEYPENTVFHNSAFSILAWDLMGVKWFFDGFGKYSLPSSHFIVSCGKSWYNLRIFTTTYGGNRCQS